MDNVRNFVIIAHIDHGKSTLADRMLEITGTVPEREMKEQVLDQMELEREKGITIKMAPVRMSYPLNSGLYILNLIDTPGHVDFGYEVSRALAAVSGAILLVDGTQGVEAQTIANLNLARSEGLAIIPAINKIDLPNCRIEETRKEIKTLLGEDIEIYLISAKTGDGVPELLKAVISKIPPPQGDADAPLRALIFDSVFDSYKGVIAYVRIIDGSLKRGEKIKMFRSGAEAESLEIGFFSPALVSQSELKVGEIGYVATGVKEPLEVRVGDTVAKASDFSVSLLPGYREPRPNVFSAVYPQNADDFEILRGALLKLRLNDAALVFDPVDSGAMGRGFLAGFLGMLHMEIVGERLKREYNLDLIFSLPSVSYEVIDSQNNKRIVQSASQIPDSERIIISEPICNLEIVTPQKYLGAVMKLMEPRRSVYKENAYLGELAILKYETPLSEVIVDLYDALKSVSEGYASMSYFVIGYQQADLVKLEVLVAGEKVDALSQIVPKAASYDKGRKLVEKLKSLLPRQLFAVSLQATVYGKIIARENISAMKKDVTGYLYGGDRTRKMKLWQKQKRGKERLKTTGKVDIPPDVFLKMVKR